MTQSLLPAEEREDMDLGWSVRPLSDPRPSAPPAPPPASGPPSPPALEALIEDPPAPPPVRRDLGETMRNVVSVAATAVVVLLPAATAGLVVGRVGPAPLSAKTAGDLRPARPVAAPTGKPTPTPLAVAPIVVRPPSSLPSGQESFGPNSTAIPWTALADNGQLAVTPVQDGVTLTLDQAPLYPSIVAPVARWFPNARVDGDVQFSSGAADNGIGLGCADNHDNTGYAFLIHDDQTWSVEERVTGTGVPQVLLSGFSNAITSTRTTSNHLAVVCSSATAGSVVLMMAVNGVPLANLAVSSSAAGWLPAISMCSCDGPDQGRFTSVSQSSW